MIKMTLQHKTADLFLKVVYVRLQQQQQQTIGRCNQKYKKFLQQRQVKLNNFLFVSTAESAALFYSSQKGR